MTVKSKIEIIIVDDHGLLRAGLKNIIEQKANMQVIGEASDGREGIKIVSKLLPDVVVIDVAMPGLNGIEATKRLKEIKPSILILVIKIVRQN